MSLETVFDENATSATTILIEESGAGNGYAQGPVRALMSALLFDGIQAYINFKLADSAAKRARYREAVNWIKNGSTKYIFSFNCVCEALGIDAEYLRFGLANVAVSDRPVWKRTRRKD